MAGAEVCKKSYITTTKKEPLSGGLVVHGPPGSGKTRLLATASQHFPEHTGEKWVELSDLLFLPFDQGALDGLKVEKLEVPFIKVREMIADMGAIKGTFEALKAASDYKKANPQVRFIMSDTLSEMSELWKEFIGRTSDNTRDLYRHLDEYHVRYHAKMGEICATGASTIPVYASHSKARVIVAETTEAQKRAAQAERLPGGNDIGLDIDGAGRHMYTRNASLIAVAMCRQVTGKEPTYCVLPRGGNGFEGKDRLARILAAEEPSHLGKIFAKINAAAA